MSSSHHALWVVILCSNLFACSSTSGSDGDAGLQDAATDHDAMDSIDATNGDAGTDSVQLGFNAKGTLNTTEQVALADAMFTNEFTSTLLPRIHVRVNGGTRSQTEFPSDWSDAQISAWVALQNEHNISLVYVVNGNDTPESQAAFIQHWIDLGARFTFLELMNEYYKRGYRLGDTSVDGVMHMVTPAIYVDEILPAFVPVLERFDLPMFAICAPKNDEFFAAWNTAMVEAFSTKEIMRGLNVTIHLYDYGEGVFDYNQISDLRSLLPAGTRIAITEAGNLDPAVTTYEAAAPLVVAHYEAILAHLLPGDFLFDQILYSDYHPDDVATLHPDFAGLTPKGEAVVQFMREQE
ncbi:MAG: hypothetical protein IPK60_08545 [Sandaracinaceae bacterium]|nr:hypothetical protein [Sandaracinaceae bacterium]